METGVTLFLEEKFQRGQFENFNVFANIYTCFPPLSMTGGAGPMILPFPWTSPAPWPFSAALKFYKYSVEIAIPLTVILIPVFHYGHDSLNIVKHHETLVKRDTSLNVENIVNL